MSRAGSCPLTLSDAEGKGVSGSLDTAPPIWFDMFTMSGVEPEIKQLKDSEQFQPLRHEYRISGICLYSTKGIVSGPC